MTQEQLELASTMWFDGAGTRAIGKLVGLTEGAMSKMAVRHRDMFPKRTIRRGNRWYLDHRDVPALGVPQDREGTMRWKTEAGVSVTLPKISLIECPRRA